MYTAVTGQMMSQTVLQLAVSRNPANPHPPSTPFDPTILFVRLCVPRTRHFWRRRNTPTTATTKHTTKKQHHHQKKKQQTFSSLSFVPLPCGRSPRWPLSIKKVSRHPDILHSTARPTFLYPCSPALVYARTTEPPSGNPALFDAIRTLSSSFLVTSKTKKTPK